MRLIVAEDDKLSRQRLQTELIAAGYAPIVTKNGAEALRAFETGEGPALLLLDWVMPILDGVAVCRRVRVVAEAPVYIVFMSSRGRQENLVEAFEAGADDFVPKPFSMETMLTRLRLGERMLSGSGAARFLFEEALVEGLRSAGGVVVTRDHGTVGRVFLAEGRVAWAHVWGQPSGIAAVLGEGHALGADEIAGVLEECRATKKHFADVLVSWGLVDPATMRDRLRSFLAARIATMADFQGARAMFVPEPWTTGPSISFALEEVYDTPPRLGPIESAPQPPSSGPLDAPPPLDVQAVADARSLCLVHGSSGAVLSHDGEAPEENIIRALLSAVQVAGAARCEEVALTDDDSYHLVQRVRSGQDHFVYARVSRRATTFAMARLQLGVVAAALRDGSSASAAAALRDGSSASAAPR